MANSKKSPPAKPEETNLGAFDPVALLAAREKPAVKAWLAAQLAGAIATLRTGPNGQSWRFNESKKPDAQAIHDFLALLTAK